MYMEKLRVFERKYLRSCTYLFRTPNSNYIKLFSNQILYHKAKVRRIDNFVIHLIRNHVIECFDCYDNNLILAPYYTDYHIKIYFKFGYVPPEIFLYLESNDFMQNETEIPISYHIYRRATNKTISCNQLTTDNSRF